jgi:hypothetical protein
MNILMVLTSHDQLGNTGRKTGFWLEEFAAPYFVFRDAGVQLTLASPKGGQPPVDPKSDVPENQTPAMARFKQDKTGQNDLAHTAKLADMKSEDFDTIFYVGGHGPMWDLAESADSISLIESFYNSGFGLPLPRCSSSGDLQGSSACKRQTCDWLHQWRRRRSSADPCCAVSSRGRAVAARSYLREGCQLAAVFCRRRPSCNWPESCFLNPCGTEPHEPARAESRLTVRSPLRPEPSCCGLLRRPRWYTPEQLE